MEEASDKKEQPTVGVPATRRAHFLPLLASPGRRQTVTDTFVGIVGTARTACCRRVGSRCRCWLFGMLLVRVTCATTWWEVSVVVRPSKGECRGNGIECLFYFTENRCFRLPLFSFVRPQ